MSKSKAETAKNPRKTLKEKQSKDFTSNCIVIDAWIINASDLSANEKLLLAKISNLIGKQACYARDDKLMVGITNQRSQLHRLLKNLELKGYINREIKGWRGQRRRNIYLSDEALEIMIEYKKGSIIDPIIQTKEIVKNQDLQNPQNVDFKKKSDLQNPQNVDIPECPQNVDITIKKNIKKNNYKQTGDLYTEPYWNCTLEEQIKLTSYNDEPTYIKLLKKGFTESEIKWINENVKKSHIDLNKMMHEWQMKDKTKREKTVKDHIRKKLNIKCK